MAVPNPRFRVPRSNLVDMVAIPAITSPSNSAASTTPETVTPTSVVFNRTISLCLK